MSHDVRNKWLNAKEATLPLGDRLFWLSLVVMVMAVGAWRVQQELGDKDISQVAFARTKRNLLIDAMPTGSIASRAR